MMTQDMCANGHVVSTISKEKYDRGEMELCDYEERAQRLVGQRALEMKRPAYVPSLDTRPHGGRHRQDDQQALNTYRSLSELFSK